MTWARCGGCGLNFVSRLPSVTSGCQKAALIVAPVSPKLVPLFLTAKGLKYDRYFSSFSAPEECKPLEVS